MTKVIQRCGPVRKLIVKVVVLCLLLSGSIVLSAAGQRERLEYGNETILAIFASMLPPALQRPGGSNWRLAHSSMVKGEYSIAEFTPIDESIEDWSKLFTQQNFTRRKGLSRTPKAMMDELRKSMQSQCPTVVWKVLAKSSSDVLYDYQVTSCGDLPDQYEIARILYGKWNVWRLAYTEKTAQIDPETRARWSAALAEPVIVRE